MPYFCIKLLPNIMSQGNVLKTQNSKFQENFAIRKCATAFFSKAPILIRYLVLILDSRWLSDLFAFEGHRGWVNPACLQCLAAFLSRANKSEGDYTATVKQTLKTCISTYINLSKRKWQGVIERNGFG